MLTLCLLPDRQCRLDIVSAISVVCHKVYFQIQLFIFSTLRVIVLHYSDIHAKSPPYKLVINNILHYMVLFRLAEVPPPTWEESLRYRLPLLAAVMTATLEGRQVVLFHGCLLLRDDGEGIVLTGESEVGKSTTFRRWQTAGGRGLCDDLMILSRGTGADGRSCFYAQPLPTWSRCLREGIAAKELRYPVNEKIPIRRILWLTRSATEREELIPVTIQKWHGQLLAACNQHMLFTQYALTVEERRQLVMECWKIVDEIDTIYSPLAFAAHLQGDLRETLKHV